MKVKMLISKYQRFLITFFLFLCGYLFLKPFLKSVSLSLGFMMTAILLLSLRFIKNSSDKLRWRSGDALLIGLAQIAAFVPGVSRFGATYVIARVRKISGYNAFAISFIASLPLDIAGFFIGLVQLRCGLLSCFTIASYFYIVISAAGSYLLLCLVLYLIKRGRLWWLGWYMLLPTVLALFM